MKLDISGVGWRAGYQAKISAEDAYEALEAIREANDGALEPEAIVKAARSKRNKLHPEFEWDDKSAAHRYRLDQARCMVRHLEVTKSKNENEIGVRVYSVVTTDKKPTESTPKKVYRTTEEILADPELRQELLSRAFAELVSFQKRYRGLQELAVVFSAAQQAMESIRV